MKIEEAGVETFTFGQKEVSVARIQASAKAFEILSSSLYSNAILAIIRELCANAKDSHTAAGKPAEPFRVQCPNDLDPQFKVRDFGVGMTHEFVMTRLNTYFDSTKNESNTEIGGFGLGIKSVFSYTTSFMVSCYDGTTRRVYTYQIGGSGLPEISFLADSPSTEPVGVEISVPVKREDYRDFQSNAVEALTFYNPRPTIAGMDTTQFDIELIYSGTGWAMYQNPGKLAADTYIEMGDVIYPIIEDVNNRHYHRGRSDVVTVYKAGIGDIDITPNREQIKLTEKSKARIEKFEEVMKAELLTQAQAFINTYTCSYWELLKDRKVRDMINSYAFRKFGIESSKLKYRGYKIDYGRSFAYTHKSANQDVLKLGAKFFVAQQRYDETVIQSLRLDHYGISVDDRNSIPIILGAPNFHKEINQGKLDHKFGAKSSAYLIECKPGTIDAIIADINRVIPDYSTFIYKWDDIKDELDHIKVPQRMIRHDIASNSYSDPKPIEFTVAHFAKMKKVYYEFQKDDHGWGGHHRLLSKLSEVCHYLPDTTVAMLHKLGIKEAYSLSEAQVEELKAAGIKVQTFTDAVNPILKDIATKFANSRPTMTLKEFLKPLTDKNRRICLSTHYKAVKRWSRESNDPKLRELMLAIADESSSSYRHSEEDRLFRALTKHGIKEYIAENKIVATNVTSNQVIKDIAIKAPLCARLVSDYNDQEVVDYVCTAMGWTGQQAAPKKTKMKKPPQRVAKVNPNVVPSLVAGI